MKNPVYRIRLVLSPSILGRRRVRYILLSDFCLRRVSIHDRSLKLGLQCLSIELSSVQVNAIDLPRVADVLQGICVEHNKIGSLAPCEGPGVVDAEHFGWPGS